MTVFQIKKSPICWFRHPLTDPLTAAARPLVFRSFSAPRGPGGNRESSAISTARKKVGEVSIHWREIQFSPSLPSFLRRPCMDRNHRLVPPMYAQNQHESLARSEIRRARDRVSAQQTVLRPSAVPQGRRRRDKLRPPSGQISVKFRFLCQHHFLLWKVSAGYLGLSLRVWSNSLSKISPLLERDLYSLIFSQHLFAVSRYIPYLHLVN